ncbi:MAG: SGNH/GDSL hydrolase family protein [Corallococcus sp.]|nr:SGNH/GDSL hydrolase family protein [Corallococcus sp.]MCM1359747.1 SGNH/GDSL hydrolase family protein [Corallococcus sp.]MCM1395456.1 SGNH/GDSL hydrolase family protein [Corallococcus sp.]
MLFNKNDKIVFAGDSVADDGRAYPVGEGLHGELGNGFVSLVDTFLSVDYPELNLRCVNMGVSGNTSRDLLARWDSDINALAPDIVVVLIGANDVWRQFDSPMRLEEAVAPADYKNNLVKIANKTSAKLIFMTPYYLEPNAADPMRARMDEYAEICKSVAAERSIPVVDLQLAFNRILQQRYPAYISWDRVHPGRIGSMIIARAFLETVGYKPKYDFRG